MSSNSEGVIGAGIGELVLAAPPGPLGKCTSCLDGAITKGEPFDIEEIADAVVLIALVQTFSLGGGQQLVAPCLAAVCLNCRKKQLGTISKTGLALG